MNNTNNDANNDEMSLRDLTKSEINDSGVTIENRNEKIQINLTRGEASILTSALIVGGTAGLAEDEPLFTDSCKEAYTNIHKQVDNGKGAPAGGTNLDEFNREFVKSTQNDERVILKALGLKTAEESLKEITVTLPKAAIAVIGAALLNSSIAFKASGDYVYYLAAGEILQGLIPAEFGTVVEALNKSVKETIEAFNA